MPDDERRRRRADHLLPEEKAAESADPQGQAEAVLADSDEREAHSRDESATVERRRSDGTDPPG